MMSKVLSEWESLLIGDVGGQRKGVLIRKSEIVGLM